VSASDYEINDTARCDVASIETRVPFDLLTTRTRKTVERLGITTLRELACITEHDVLMQRNSGNKTVAELRGVLAGHGLSFASKHVRPEPRVRSIFEDESRGSPIYGFKQIAAHLGIPPKELKLYAAARTDPAPVYRSSIHGTLGFTTELDAWLQRKISSDDAMFAHRRHLQAKLLVYVITYEISDRFKVGFTNDLAKRISSIESHCGYPIRVIATIPGGPDLEACIHERLHEFRRFGEWFEACEESLERVRTVVRNGGGTINEADSMVQKHLGAVVA